MPVDLGFRLLFNTRKVFPGIFFLSFLLFFSQPKKFFFFLPVPYGTGNPSGILSPNPFLSMKESRKGLTREP